MKRYYIEMYAGRKFIGNYDFETLEACLKMIDSCVDKITVKDMETNKVYVVKEKREK
jgi:hypothetical protein